MQPHIPVKSVAKALDLLATIVFTDSAHDGLTVGELAHRRGTPLSSLHNLLTSMCAGGWVERSERGRYRAGPMIAAIGRLNSWCLPQRRQEVGHILEAANAEVRENMNFTVLLDGRRVLVALVSAQRQVRLDNDHLEQAPFWRLNSARCLAAWSDAHARDRALAVHGMPGTDWDGIRTREALERACTKLLNKGLGRIVNEDVCSLCKPVLHGDELLGIVSCYGPRFRMKQAQEKQAIAAIDQAVQAIAKLDAL